MINKFVCDAREALADVSDGSTIMVGGFGEAGSPMELLDALIDHGATGLTVISNNAGADTLLAEGKERREFNGSTYIMERALFADFALIKARRADRFGNLQYNKTARNFGPIMAMAARTTVVQVSETCLPGEMDPETVVTRQVTKYGVPKLVSSCTLSLTGRGVVKRIFTNLATIDVLDGCFAVTALAPGINLDYLQARTNGPVTDCRVNFSTRIEGH